MPLIPGQGPPMPGMAMLPPAPQAQPSPMMGPPGMAPGMPPGGDPLGLPTGGLGGAENPTQDVVLGLLTNQQQADAQAAQIMGQGAMSADQRAQGGMAALAALIESMAAAPSPAAVGAITEGGGPPAAGMGLPPGDPTAGLGGPPMGPGGY